MLGSWIGATLQSACFPRIDVDVAQSRYAVVLLGFGGLVQPGGSSSHIFIVLLIMFELPAGSHRQLVAAVCAAFTDLSATLFSKTFALSAAFWGASRQFWGRCHISTLLQTAQCWGTTNDVLPNLFFVGQDMPAELIHQTPISASSATTSIARRWFLLELRSLPRVHQSCLIWPPPPGLAVQTTPSCPLLPHCELCPAGTGF